MGATRFEYRFRFILHAVIYILCFWSPWTQWLGLRDISAWVWIAQQLSEHGWLKFFAATDSILVLALVFTGLGAWFRFWGSAYVGSSVVASRDMHSQRMLADGPYRRTRNPLYLGTLLHTIGISILMPVSGAALCIVLIWVLQVRLALAEEPFLAQRFGEPYITYKNTVPRFLPSPTPLVPPAGQQPHWLQSLAGELYFVAVFFILAILGWGFNSRPIMRGILISLGVWFIARAFLPKPAESV